MLNNIKKGDIVAVMGYLPILLVSGVIMGVFIGITGYFLIKSLKKIDILSLRQ